MTRCFGKYRVFWALWLGMGGFVLLAAAPGELRAYRHHTTKVTYMEYSQASFDRAREENKPIFMLVSAVWCYWCKAYTERTLETPEVVGFLNENFINVFVDYDQRQDLKNLYVDRGIPTSVVFTPQGKEFISFAGLLNAKEFLDGMGKVLADIRKKGSAAYGSQTASLKDVRGFITRRTATGPKDWKALSAEQLALLVDLTLSAYDPEQEGIGADKKYPQGELLGLLLERGLPANNEELLEVVTATLNRIATHLYDPIEGGFFRYADNRAWRRIRYEKMLTTTARMVRVFQLAKDIVPLDKQPEGERRYARIYRHSLNFLLTTFSAPGGGFYSSLDGKHPAYYRLSSGNRAASKAKPQLDRTFYTAYNAEAVVFLVDVERADPDPRLRKVLEGVLDLLANRMFSSDKGFRSYSLPGKTDTVGEGQLTDNAWGALAMAAGYELTGRKAYLHIFEETAAFARRQLLIPELGVFRLWNVPNHAGLREDERVAREVPLVPNAVMAQALLRGHRITGNAGYRTLAEGVLHALTGLETDLFDENPNDGGKTYLGGLAHLVRAQQLLASVGS